MQVIKVQAQAFSVHVFVLLLRKLCKLISSLHESFTLKRTGRVYIIALSVDVHPP